MPPDWLLVLLLVAGVYLWQRSVFPLWMLDSFPNQFAAFCYNAGREDLVYTDSAHLHEWEAQADSLARTLGLDCDIAPFMYAPFVMEALAPFAQVSPLSWRNTVFVINTLLLFVFAYLIARISGAKLSYRSYLWALGLILITYPMARATKLGQIVPLIAALFWIGILYLRRGKEIAGGMVIGLVSALKLFPIAVLPVMILRKQFKATLTALLTVILIYGVSLLTIGIQLHRKWFRSMMDFGGAAHPYFGNQSIAGWISRMGFGQLMEGTMPTSEPLFVYITTITATILAVITLAVLWTTRDNNNVPGLEVRAVFVLSGLLLAVWTSWEHYWLFCLSVLGWAIRDVWTEGRIGRSQYWIAVTAFFFLMKLTRFYTDTDLGRIASGTQTIGMLMLWLWLIWRLRAAHTETELGQA